MVSVSGAPTLSLGSILKKTGRTTCGVTVKSKYTAPTDKIGDGMVMPIVSISTIRCFARWYGTLL